MSIPNSITAIGESVFENCAQLTSIAIPNGVTRIENKTFSGCTRMTSVSIPSSVTAIGESAFENCAQLVSIAIPNGVTCIEKNSFSGCEAKIILPDNILQIDNDALGKCDLYVHQGSISLLTIWNFSRDLNTYDIETNNLLHAPSVDEITKTQTTIKVKVNNYYNGYVYEINDEDYVNLPNTGYIYKKLCPNTSYYIRCRVSKGDVSFYFDKYITTNPINMIIDFSATSSSLAGTCSYESGDATVVPESDFIKINGENINGNQWKAIGLHPNSSFTITYYVTVRHGKNEQELYTFSKTKTCRTMPLQLTPQAPKVVSSGNVIVAALTNLDDEETNVGVEWRRTDWTADFVSNSGMAYLYEGTIEGYIHNLNTDKLWKYRAYYETASGTRHYSEWMGIDPTNASYFEPTIHTYPIIKGLFYTRN